MNPFDYSNHDTDITRSLARRQAARKAQNRSAQRANNAVLYSLAFGAVISIAAWIIRSVF